MPAKAIMIQGTMSSAGKSLIAAGLCRVFHQDGLRVAPFKSQNMALNSFITREGLEMGRAQVVQAQAAGVEPDVRMNPILLKPQSDTGSQVIVNGEVWGNMAAAEYYRRKPELLPCIRRAYESLAAQYDVVVIEGAGSPAEINLKENDIVNMGMARLARAPVLLVGDIDRGGVFASLYGTAALLEDWERRHLAGLIINKFRGDVALLRPGLTQIETLTGLPVVGVVPWLRLDIDDEDSLSSRLEGRPGAFGAPEIAILRFPRISNFTDFAPLETLPGVSVRYVTCLGELGEPDFIILPGTKSTIGPAVAAAKRPGGGDKKAGGPRDAGPRRLRRLPDAGPYPHRPGGGGGGAGDDGGRAGAAAGGYRLRGGEGPHPDGGAGPHRSHRACGAGKGPGGGVRDTHGPHSSGGGSPSLLPHRPGGGWPGAGGRRGGGKRLGHLSPRPL